MLGCVEKGCLRFRIPYSHGLVGKSADPGKWLLKFKGVQKTRYIKDDLDALAQWVLLLKECDQKTV